MTRLDGHRVYLDWNATAPLRPEARAAMLAAMDVVGNPSSVHAEGRAARAIVEKARAQLAALVGSEPGEVVFTSGATEAIDIVFRQSWDVTGCSPFEHDAVVSRSFVHATDWVTREPLADRRGYFRHDLMPSGFGMYNRAAQPKKGDRVFHRDMRGLFAVAAANAETGVRQPVRETLEDFAIELPVGMGLCDATQAVGKTAFSLSALRAAFVAVSGHKIGSSPGVGALIVRSGVHLEVPAGGGQESGRRSGTENVVGIAGFGAAAEAAARDLDAGVWEGVSHLRDALEERLESAAPDLIFVGRGAPRLPNTSCFAVPGWAGETQVMQMDLAGFAVSAGSACSSGKVKKASRVLLAMGFDETTASSAIRVSLGPTTTEAGMMAFADAWIDRYRRRNSRAA